MDVSEEELDKEIFNMALIVPKQAQRPYRFGMTLLCIGALFNWLGFANSYTEPVPVVRYIGVGLIAAGSALICLAMCFWMRAVHDPQYARECHNRQGTLQVINIQEPDPRSLEKPPEYNSVVDYPPSYEDAIKLDPNQLLYFQLNKETIKTTIDNNNIPTLIHLNIGVNEIDKLSKETINGAIIKDNNNTNEREYTVVLINDNSNNKINEIDKCTNDIETKPNLVNENILPKSNLLTNVFRKSFRVLRKPSNTSIATTPVVENLSENLNLSSSGIANVNLDSNLPLNRDSSCSSNISSSECDDDLKG